MFFINDLCVSVKTGTALVIFSSQRKIQAKQLLFCKFQHLENTMTTIKKTFIALATIIPVLTVSLSSQATSMTHMNTALVDVCKAAQSNKVFKLKSTMESYQLKDKTVALKVMCNGDDIITFAEKSGAIKTANQLQKSIGDVSITDVAAIDKMAVTFTE